MTTIHHYDPQTGEFLASTEARLDPIGGEPLVPAYATEQAPPEPPAGEIAVRLNGDDQVPAKGRNGSWRTIEDHRGEAAHDIDTHEPVEIEAPGPLPEGVALGEPEDHRGETVYDTATGAPTTIETYGPLPDGYTTLVPPSYPVWDNGAWTVDEAAALDGARAKKLRELQRAMDAELADIRTLWPASERETWPKQEQEARAWTADNSVSTPLLSAIATARGIDVATLAPKVIANADTFTAQAGAAAGKRQRLEGDVEAAYAAGDRQTLESITWESS